MKNINLLNKNDLLDIAVNYDGENHKKYLKIIEIINTYLNDLYNYNLQLYKKYKSKVISDIVDILNDNNKATFIMNIKNDKVSIRVK